MFAVNQGATCPSGSASLGRKRTIGFAALRPQFRTFVQATADRPEVTVLDPSNLAAPLSLGILKLAANSPISSDRKAEQRSIKREDALFSLSFVPDPQDPEIPSAPG